MFNLPESSKIPPMPDLLPPGAEDGPGIGSASLNPASATLNPSLPFPGPGKIVFPPIRSVRAGCWLLNYRPSGAALVSYDGTLRVESHSEGRTASGDLYQRPVIFLPVPIVSPFPQLQGKVSASPNLSLKPIMLAGPNPASGIPIPTAGRWKAP